MSDLYGKWTKDFSHTENFGLTSFIYGRVGKYPGFACSKCNKISDTKYAFCPYCGSPMELDDW